MLKKIDLMHSLYGKSPGKVCRDCRHLHSYTANRRYYKCECYGETSSEATDWRLKWNACGLIDVDASKEIPVVKRRIQNSKRSDPAEIAGQMSIYDYEGVTP